MSDTKIVSEGRRGPRGRDDGEDDCDRGKRGHRGPSGPTGPTGPGGSAAGGLLKFSGVAAPSINSTPLISYLADAGVGVGTVPIITTAPSYPVAIPHNLQNLSTNVQFTLSAGLTLVIQLLKNGAPVAGFLTTYGAGDSGIKSVATAEVPFAIGDTLDLRVTTTGVFDESGLNVSATIGVA